MLKGANIKNLKPNSDEKTAHLFLQVCFLLIEKSAVRTLLSEFFILKGVRI